MATCSTPSPERRVWGLWGPQGQSAGPVLCCTSQNLVCELAMSSLGPRRLDALAGDGAGGKGWGLNLRVEGAGGSARRSHEKEHQLHGQPRDASSEAWGRGQETQKSRAVQLRAVRSAAQGISKAGLAPSFPAASVALGSPRHLHAPASLRAALRAKAFSQDHASTLRMPSCPAHCCF